MLAACGHVNDSCDYLYAVLLGRQSQTVRRSSGPCSFVRS